MVELVAGGLFSMGVITGVVVYLLVRCNHDWNLISDKDFPPKLEDMDKAGMDVDFLWGNEKLEAARRKYVAFLRCKKCPATKVMKTSS